MKSSLIEIGIGKAVLYEDGRVGVVRDIKITPNGISNPKLVALLFVEIDNEGKKSMVSATSDRFFPAEDEEYEELYPSVHLNRMVTEIENRTK